MDDENVQFDQSLKKIEFLTKLSGINIRSGEISSIEKRKYRIIYLINYIWLNIDLAGGIYWFIDGMIMGKDFLGLTSIVPCILFITLANIKGLFLIMNKKPAFKLVKNLKNLEMKLREHSREENEIFAREKAFLHIVIKVNNCLYIIVMIFFALSPLVLIFLNYHKTGELDLILPFLILYPFDPYNPKIWPFVYVHQLWSQAIMCFNIGFADLFFFTCCTYIRIQFKFLQYKIENLIPVQYGNRLFVEDDEFKEKFKNIVKWHQDVIKSVNILEGVYSKSTLLNFVSCSTVVCLTGFNVTMGNNMTIVLTLLCFLSMSIIQVFFLCFFAALMTTASMEIADAVYKSRWYMAETSVRKKLLIILIRGQKPCRLTAFGFADVNLNSLMRGTAWSYLALLQTIYAVSNGKY